MDWQKLLKDLDGRGQTQTQIAERCGVAQSTVSDLARGKSQQPSFAFGAKLIELHGELIGAHGAPPLPEPAQAGEAAHG